MPTTVKEKLKILQVCSSKSWGGMEMFVADFSCQLQARGHQVLILTSPDSRLGIKSKSLNLPVRFLNFGGYFQPVIINQLVNFIKNSKFDLIHCHYGRDLWSLVPSLKFSKKLPLILMKHIGTQKAKKDILHNFLYKNVDFIIANSQIIYKNILATHPVDKNRVGVIHPGIDTAKFYPNPGLKSSIRKILNIKEEAFVIGMSGRLQRWKGHYEFLNMAAELKEKYDYIYFVVIGGATVGEKDEAEGIYREAKRLNLENRLIFTGFRNDVADLLNAMDLFVFPSYAEAYGMALLEAMAVGLPVIASNCDGVLDIIEDGRTGILITPRNSESLINAVTQLINQKKQRMELARNGYENFKSNFTSQQMIKKVEKLYFSMLKR